MYFQAILRAHQLISQQLPWLLLFQKELWEFRSCLSLPSKVCILKALVELWSANGEFAFGPIKDLMQSLLNLSGVIPVILKVFWIWPVFLAKRWWRVVPQHLSVLSSKATSGFFCSLLLLYLRLQFHSCGPGAQACVVFYTHVLPLFLNTHHEASRTKYHCKNHKIFQTLHVFFLRLFLPTSPSCVSHIFAVFLRYWRSVSNKEQHRCSYKTGNIFPCWKKAMKWSAQIGC